VNDVRTPQRPGSPAASPAARPSTRPAAAAGDPALRPTAAFVGLSWAALLTGCLAFVTGLWNARMPLSEKGFYLTVLMFGLFAAVSLQKSVRDRVEGITVSGVYFGLCWVGAGAAVVLLSVGLWNAPLADSEKGFYAMAYALAVFAAVAVQKNVRDLARFDDHPDGPSDEPAGPPSDPRSDPPYGTPTGR
jgi:uncharacterized membrane protein YiaA